MRFEWDPVKADINMKRHGIRFEEAVESFFDPDAADDYDDEHSEYEDRYNLIGFSSHFRIDKRFLMYYSVIQIRFGHMVSESG